MDETFDALVGRALAGEGGALPRLIEHCLPGLRAWIRLQTGEALRAKESASDLAQSVCLELLQDLSSFEYRGEAAFRQWLYRAAERKIRDRARYWQAERRDVAREQRPRAEDERADELLDCYATFCTPSRVAVAREELARIETAFAALSPEHREVILLARMLGLPHAEIAQRMHRSEGAVRVLLFRALAELAEELGE
jgi:RNA polymerase sigma-70 factor (ECF subfamily)